jgi:hypothetical protein
VPDRSQIETYLMSSVPTSAPTPKVVSVHDRREAWKRRTTLRLDRRASSASWMSLASGTSAIEPFADESRTSWTARASEPLCDSNGGASVMSPCAPWGRMKGDSSDAPGPGSRQARERDQDLSMADVLMPPVRIRTNSCAHPVRSGSWAGQPSAVVTYRRLRERPLGRGTPRCHDCRPDIGASIDVRHRRMGAQELADVDVRWAVV